jgi:hypothetical protein
LLLKYGQNTRDKLQIGLKSGIKVTNPDGIEMSENVPSTERDLNEPDASSKDGETSEDGEPGKTLKINFNFFSHNFRFYFQKIAKEAKIACKGGKFRQ